MLKQIILVGGGGHCKSCIEIIEAQKKFRIAGIIDKSKDNDLNYKNLGNDNDIALFKKKFKYAFVTLGQIKDYKKLSLFNLLKKLNFTIPIIISPESIVSKKSIIGNGTIVMHKALIGPSVSIGSNCIINNGSQVEHDSVIHDNCHISTGAIINGKVEVGKNSFIGSGAIIKNNIKIGDNVIIGASCYVDQNIKSNQIIKKK